MDTIFTTLRRTTFIELVQLLTIQLIRGPAKTCPQLIGMNLADRPHTPTHPNKPIIFNKKITPKYPKLNTNLPPFVFLTSLAPHI